MVTSAHELMRTIDCDWPDCDREADSRSTRCRAHTNVEQRDELARLRRMFNRIPQPPCRTPGCDQESEEAHTSSPYYRLCPACRRVRRQHLGQVQRRWTADAIVQGIRDHAAANGGRPPSSMEARGMATAAMREFGSWADAVEHAGFPRPRHGGWNDHELGRQLEALR